LSPRAAGLSRALGRHWLPLLLSSAGRQMAVGRACLIQRGLYSSAMTVLAQVDLGTLGRVGTALADPTRRRVLVHLIDGPGYPAEMAEDFGTTRANLSNHLTCLRECGLVTATAEGRRVRYDLADQRLADGLRTLAALDLPAPADEAPRS
jgi:DNA-binding transcriptional ArsR family regulator